MDTIWQRKLRNQASRKKKRRRGLQSHSNDKHSITKMQKEEYLIKNACYSQAKYYLCKQNNKRSLLGRKQRSQVARSFPNRYQFNYVNKVTSLFSIRYTLIIILQCILLHCYTCISRLSHVPHFCICIPLIIILGSSGKSNI